MNEQIKALCHLETESSRLNFDQDPDYQLYYTQAQALWEGGDMPSPLFRLLETSNALAFAHGLRTGAALCGQVSP